MVQPDESSEVRGMDGPGLLILTGPSHTGKTAVSKKVLTATPGPAAYLSVDDALERTLQRPAGDIWSEIPLAYELIGSELKILLEKGWFVVVESTFTYVPEEGEGELHDDALNRLIAVASSREIPWWVVQLTATRETILARAGRTDRLDPEVVSGTFALHQDASFPVSVHVVDTEAPSPAEAAAAILAHLRASRS